MESRNNSLLGIGAIVLLLIAWQIAATAGWINPFFTSYPSKIFSAFVELFVSGFIFKHLGRSALELFVGLTIGVCLGVVFGVLTGWYKAAQGLLGSFVTTFYVTPVIVLVPLLIVWFGVGVTVKVIVVSLAVFFPMVINVRAGIKNIDPDFIRTARAFGANDLQIFSTVALPSSLPYILSGLRLSIGRGLMGVIVAELYGSGAGLGYLMTLFSSTFQIDKLMAVIVIFIVAGVGMTGLVQMAEDKVRN